MQLCGLNNKTNVPLKHYVVGHVLKPKLRKRGTMSTSVSALDIQFRLPPNSCTYYLNIATQVF